MLVGQEALGQDVVAATASSPTGPWVGHTTVYRTPTWGAGSFTYNATPHPQLGRDGDLVIGYSVNSSDVDYVSRYADLYRPRFVRVPARCLPTSARPS